MKYLLIYNPISGKNIIAKKLDLIKKMFAENLIEMDFYETKYKNHLLNEDIPSVDSYDSIIIAGGDGTINELINNFMNKNIKKNIGIIPIGTANDFASILGIPRNIKRACKLILNNNKKFIDINKVNDRYFTYGLACGMFSDVSYDTKIIYKKRFGWLSYLFKAIKKVRKVKKMDLEISYEGINKKGSYTLLLFLSSKRVAGFRLRKMKENKIDDGLIDLIIFNQKQRFFSIGFFLVFGIGIRKKNIINSNKFEIKSSKKEDIIWNTDGEKSSNGDAIITVHKQALSFYINIKKTKNNFSSTKEDKL